VPNTWMSGEVNLPAVGGVDKRLLLAIGLGGVGFVGYRYWRARKDAAAAPTDATASDFVEGDGTTPDVLNSVPTDNRFGQDDQTTEPPSADTFGFRGTTNSQWAEYASTRLSQSETWTYTDIVSALGNFLAGSPLTTLGKQIVQAALGLAGQPPMGQFPLIGGGDAPLTVAPAILTITAKQTEVTLTYSAVPGASGYRATYDGGGATGITSGTKIIVSGLTPNKRYTFQVRGVSAAGVDGPASSGRAITTGKTTLKTPGRPKVSSITAHSAHFSVSAVSGASRYIWHINKSGKGGITKAESTSPAFTDTHLAHRTLYSVTVQADSAASSPTHESARASFRTKR